jgi:hypothetical protein
MAEAHMRFRNIAGTLDAAADVGTIRTGFAEFTPDETAAALIARADREMIRTATTNAEFRGNSPM